MKKYDVLTANGSVMEAQKAGAGYGGSIGMVTLLTKDNRIAMDFTSCKDFISDLVYSCFHDGVNVCHYNAMGPGKNSLMPDLGNPRLAIQASVGPALFMWPRYMNALDAANAGLDMMCMKERITVDNIIGDINSKTHGLIIVYKLPRFLIKAPPLLAFVALCLRSLVTFEKSKIKFSDFVDNCINERKYNNNGYLGALNTGNSDLSYLEGWVKAIKFFRESANIYKVFAGTPKENWALSKASVHSKFGISYFGALIDQGVFTKKKYRYSEVMLSRSSTA